MESSVAEGELTDLAASLSDVTLEMILKAGDAFPIFSFLTKGVKATMDIREAFFAEKVFKFLKSLGEAPEAERQKMIKEIQESEKYRQKFGKFSIVVLERLNDDLKAEYLGRAAKYLVVGDIDYGFYQRFALILDALFIDDLHRLTDNNFLSIGDNHYDHYLSLGLISVSMRLPNESETRMARKMNQNIIKVSHRHLTDKGLKVKNILLDLPIKST